LFLLATSSFLLNIISNDFYFVVEAAILPEMASKTLQDDFAYTTLTVAFVWRHSKSIRLSNYCHADTAFALVALIRGLTLTTHVHAAEPQSSG
jgi:hypothetical protein